MAENMRENGVIFQIFEKNSFLKNDKLMHMITIFLILKLNLKNSYKPSKTLLQCNFLVPPNEEGLVL